VRPSSAAERGFVLVTTLLVMTLLTVLLTAAFLMISAESRTTGSAYETGRSLNLAQAGLQGYFASSHNLTTGRDSTNYTFPGGYARVVAQQLRDSTALLRPLWVVYSTGIDTTRSLMAAGGALRVVGQLAHLDAGRLPTRAAVVSPTGVHLTGGIGQGQPMNGTNFNSGVCTIPVGTPTDTFGLTMPTGATYSSSGNTGDSRYYPTGGVEYLSSASAVIDSTRIDWAKLVGGEFVPDYYGSWPNPCSGSGCVNSSFLFTGDATVPAGQRRGLLVVYGNVTFAASAHWDGIILAGGYLKTPNSGVIHGMVVTALNTSLGQTVPPDTIARAASTLRWDWCYTVGAVAALSYLTPIRGTYTDTWDTY